LLDNLTVAANMTSADKLLHANDLQQTRFVVMHRRKIVSTPLCGEAAEYRSWKCHTCAGYRTWGKRASNCSWVPRRAMSVQILSTVEKIGTTNPQQVAVMELEGYSCWTCRKQPRLVDCRIGVVNKLDRRRRRRRILLTTRTTGRGEIFKSGVWDKVPEGSTVIFGCIQISLQHSVTYLWKEAPMPKPSSIRPVVLIQCPLVTDGRTDGQTHDDSKYRASIASGGKNASRSTKSSNMLVR